MTTSFLRQLPRYQCHKQVSALKIKAVIPNPRGFELHFEDERFAPHEVSASWVAKHRTGPIDSFELLAGGYLVAYDDGYLSWSPAGAFESGYTLVDASVCVPGPLDFGDAIRALKAGKRVARAGWNGKGMWLSLSAPPSDGPFALARSIPADSFWSENNRAYAEENGGFATVLPCITMKTATGEILMGWLASQSDMLATDWVVL